MPRSMKMAAFSLAPSLLLLVACSSTTTGTGTSAARQAVDADSLCDRMVNDCQVTTKTKEECVDIYSLVRVSQACLDALKAASCEDLGDNGSATSDVVKNCFPSCSGGADSCNGDGTITHCGDGKAVTLDCAGVCDQAGKEYSGTCGTSFGEQASSDGNAKCWCK
jgi:hypothetical protein